MAQDIYARVITRDGVNQFEIPVVVLEMLGVSDVKEIEFDVPEGGEFMYMKSEFLGDKDIEIKEQQR